MSLFSQKVSSSPRERTCARGNLPVCWLRPESSVISSQSIQNRIHPEDHECMISSLDFRDCVLRWGLTKGSVSRPESPKGKIHPLWLFISTFHFMEIESVVSMRNRPSAPSSLGMPDPQPFSDTSTKFVSVYCSELKSWPERLMDGWNNASAVPVG